MVWLTCPLSFVESGGRNVSCVRFDRRILFGLGRMATESSEVVRCLLRGLRAAILAVPAASGENIASITACL